MHQTRHHRAVAKGWRKIEPVDETDCRLVHKGKCRFVHKTKAGLVYETKARLRHCRIVPFRRYGRAANIILAWQDNRFEGRMVLVNPCIDHRNSYSAAGSGSRGECLFEPYLCACRLIGVSLPGWS